VDPPTQNFIHMLSKSSDNIYAETRMDPSSLQVLTSYALWVEGCTAVCDVDTKL